jgi:pyruvate formate lyase activating enzyme
MLIAGVHFNSFVDYPGQIAAVVFASGCNLACPWCHNYGLTSPQHGKLVYNTCYVLSDFKRRRTFLDAVVITGGEPTIQKNLDKFLIRLKEMGFLVKLDTNGIMPDVIKDLIQRSLLDYIAMDIKAPFDKYREITNRDVDAEVLRESVRVIMGGGVDYEFRTTFVPGLAAEDFDSMAEEIKGAERYFIQQFRVTPKYMATPHTKADFRRAVDIAAKKIKAVQTRGL